jgi:hypothetical protein
MKKRRLIDLSIAIEPDLPSDPPMMVPKIQYLGHDQGADSMKLFFPGLQNEHLPGAKDGLWSMWSFQPIPAHTWTHPGITIPPWTKASRSHQH